MQSLTANIPSLKRLISLSIALCFTIGYAQQDVVFNPIPNAIAFSVDRMDNVYYVTPQQDVKKLGHPDLVYSPQKRRSVTHIEAWNTAKIFLFSREFQEYTLLDRYLTEISTTGFNIEEVGFASFATMALDGNIWLIDNTDFSLKKISLSSNKTLLTTNLNLIIDQAENEVVFMKEYGNFLYVSTIHNGILVFDNLGTYKKRIPYNNVPFIGFRNDAMYFVKDGNIISFDLLRLSETSKPVSTDITSVLWLERGSYAIKK